MPSSNLAESHRHHPTALLIIDMISGWDFPDAGRLLAGAAVIAPRIAALKARCVRDDVPVIFANDNHGRWRSDFRHVFEASLEAGGEGARIGGLLAPGDDDYFILKPKHSAFFSTPLDLLLKHLGAQRLVLTGVSSDQCVLATAADAKMRDYEVVVPRDAVASLTDERNERAVAHFDGVLGVPTTPAARVRLVQRG